MDPETGYSNQPEAPDPPDAELEALYVDSIEQDRFEKQETLAWSVALNYFEREF
jgi:hypothetical protein